MSRKKIKPEVEQEIELEKESIEIKEEIIEKNLTNNKLDTNMIILIDDNNKAYSYSELIKILSKRNKTIGEELLIKEFKKVMDDLYLSIERAVSTTNSERITNVKELKKVIKYDDVIKRIDKSKRNEETRALIDIVLDFIEKYE